MRSLLLFSLLSLSTAHAVENGTPENILGYQPGRTGITFQVHSGGCTHPDDFRVDVKRSSVGTTELKLLRIRPDPCLSFLPTGIRFKLSYDTLGLTNGERFTITNANGNVYRWIWD